MNIQPNVIRIEPLKIAGSWKWEENSEKIPSSLMIIDPEFDKHLLPASLSPAVCQYGQTYLKCPFDDRYILLQEYEDTVLQAKIREIVNILTDLGATYIKWETELIGLKQRDIDEEFNTVIPQGDLKIRMKSSESEAINHKFSSEWTNEAIEIDKEGYETALVRAKQCGLENDMVISTLLNARNPQKKARNKTLKQSTCISSELNNVLDIACSLNAIKGLIHLDNSFHKTTSIKRELETTFEVNFD
ncbi:hypothetical protein [Xylanibacter rarus]|uniref:hypothetical protein n=1 Tax=Xylanibacter rarus TaxID=1676614 RepID=UPI003AB9AEFA